MQTSYSVSELEKMMKNQNYDEKEEYKYKIYVDALQYNVDQECYRDQLVSFYQMSPLMNKSVSLEEADYILYANPYARVEDFTERVLSDLEYIYQNKKENAEIIVLGKGVNIKPYIEGKYENITYVESHYAEYVAKRFGFDFKEQYFVYDDRFNQLNIWPVDGCLNKCGFCRRTYMNIPFESQPLEFIKEQLDFYKENYPELMWRVSLRAENLTEYGIDLYGYQRLDELIDILDSYDEIKRIELPIGMAIGEINDKILESLCRTKKITNISLNLEAGSNRLLELVGKKHTIEKAVEICTKLKEANPNICIDSTVMVGLPTESLQDIYELADTILKCKINYIHCNYYGYSPKHPIAKYPQVSESLKLYHLKLLIRLLKKNYNNYKYPLQMYHEKIEDKNKRSVIRNCEKRKIRQKYIMPRLYSVEYENFIGHDISIKEETRSAIRNNFEEKVKKHLRMKKLEYLFEDKKV